MVKLKIYATYTDFFILTGTTMNGF